LLASKSVLLWSVTSSPKYKGFVQFKKIILFLVKYPTIDNSIHPKSNACNGPQFVVYRPVFLRPRVKK
jgi:hypothetical protein